jgi:malate dehydrogenase
MTVAQHIVNHVCHSLCNAVTDLGMPCVCFSTHLTPPLLLRLLLLQEAGTEVVEAKAGGGSATLSMAYAAARMAESTLLGLQGEPNMYECAFVQSDVSGCVGWGRRVLLV